MYLMFLISMIFYLYLYCSWFSSRRQREQRTWFSSWRGQRCPGNDWRSWRKIFSTARNPLALYVRWLKLSRTLACESFCNGSVQGSIGLGGLTDWPQASDGSRLVWKYDIRHVISKDHHLIEKSQRANSNKNRLEQHCIINTSVAFQDFQEQINFCTGRDHSRFTSIR